MAERSIAVAITAVDRWSAQMDAFRKRVDLESRQTKKFALNNKGAFLDVRNALGKFQGTAQGALGVLTRFAPALAPLGAALSAKEMVQNTMQWGNSVRQMAIQSKALGVPVARLNALAKAADQMGGSGEAVKSILGNLSSRQFQAAHGMDPQFTANMKMLGIERKEWEKARPDELYKRINEALRQKIPMGQLGDAAAEVYGANATGILPILQQQGKVYDAHVASLEKQYALNEGNVKALTALADKAGELEQTTKAIGESVAAWAAPGLIQTLDYAIKAEKWLDEKLSKKAVEKRQKELPKTISEVLHPEKKTGQKTLGQAMSGFFSRSMASGERVGLKFAKGVSGAFTPAQAAAAEIPEGKKPLSDSAKLSRGQIRSLSYDPNSHFLNQHQLDIDRRGVDFGNSKHGQNARYLYQFFRSKGWSKEATAGILANLSHESSLNPAAKNKYKTGGIAQWIRGRREEFKKKVGIYPEDASLDQQASYLDESLKKGEFKSVGNELKNAKTPQEAGYLFGRDYETPGVTKKDLLPDINARAVSAKDWYDALEKAFKVEIDFKNLPKGVSASASSSSDGLKIKSIKQQRAMQPGTEGF